MLEQIKEVWAGNEVGPSIAGPPGLVVGGHADAVLRPRRALRRGLDRRRLRPRAVRRGREKVRAAWAEAGREDEPRIMALAYFSLGERAEEDASGYWATTTPG